MRLRHAQALIRDFLKRWGIYLLVGPAILTVGSNAPFAMTSSLAGTLVLPLYLASENPPWVFPVSMLYAVAGALPVFFSRPLWWPYGWADAERALPVSAEAIGRSDRKMAMWLMLPWQCVLLIGCVALIWLDPTRRTAALGWAIGGWALSTTCSLSLSVAWMQRVRSHASQSTASDPNDHPRPKSAASGHPASIAQLSVHWTSAYFLLALRRGPARGSARILTIGLSATVACGLGSLLPLNLGWPLAVLALISLISAGMLRGRSDLDLLPLHLSNLHLPITPRRWKSARTALALVPTLGGWLALLPGVFITPDTRHGMLLVYLVLVGSGCAWEAAMADKAANRTARWLLMTVLVTVVSFEIAPQ